MKREFDGQQGSGFFLVCDPQTGEKRDAWHNLSSQLACTKSHHCRSQIMTLSLAHVATLSPLSSSHLLPASPKTSRAIYLLSPPYLSSAIQHSPKRSHHSSRHSQLIEGLGGRE